MSNDKPTASAPLPRLLPSYPNPLRSVIRTEDGLREYVDFLNAAKKERHCRQKHSHAEMAHSAPLNPVERARVALDLLSAMVPARIANEEIGDALEIIHRMAAAKCPKWRIYLRVATTFFWVSVHTLSHSAERVAGGLKAVTGRASARD